jgi:GR25 family glycosyltransferase involved in LPS biosynthesis
MENTFDTYVISLNTPNDLLYKLKECHLDPILFKGTNGKTLDYNTIKKYTTPIYSIFGPKSSIGCSISHISVWKTFLQSNKQYAVIFEDDIIFESHNLKSQISFYLSNTPTDFDILYLGCFGSDLNNTFFNTTMNLLNISCKFAQINDHITKPRVALALHAYIISRSGAQNLIKLLDRKIHNHIDFCIQNLDKQNLISRFVTNPRLVYQTSTDTTPSQNSSNSYPILFNNILSQYYIDNYVKASYITTVSIFRIFNYNITLSNILIFIICLYLYISNESIYFILVFILIISLPDLFNLNKVMKLIHKMMSNLNQSLN